VRSSLRRVWREDSLVSRSFHRVFRRRSATADASREGRQRRGVKMRNTADPPSSPSCAAYIFEMMFSPNSEHLISVAPSIRRAKS
jgi:hypothetical protein